MANQTFLVYVSMDNTDHLVGALTAQIKGTRETAAFQYSQEWLINPKRFELAPDMPLVASMIFSPRAMRLFLVLR